MQRIAAMGNHTEGNGRNGRNVALPDENRPSWRPQDEHGQRARRSLSEEDDRYEEERYQRHWEDRGFESRNQGYPGSFEDRYRDREREHAAEERHGGRGGSAYYDRGYQPERYERYERYGVPRGYGYGDGDRPNLGTGGGMQGGSASGTHAMPLRTPSATVTGVMPSGHRGKGPASYQRSDDRIRELICEALTEDDRIDATNIEVSVKNGEVALVGTVDDRQMKRVAEDVVESIGGVKDVQNQIRVGREHRRGTS
jgi:hypothetical protein